MKKLFLFLLGVWSVQVVFGAIVADNPIATVSNGNGDSTKTVSYTVSSGSNRILYWLTGSRDSNPMATVTYGGVSMTKICQQIPTSGDSRITLWQLVAPATGANDIVMTLTAGANYITYGGVNFTGAKQTSQPTATSSSNDGGSASYALSANTSGGADFGIMALFAQSAGALTGGVNTTIGSQPEAGAFGTAYAYTTTGATSSPTTVTVDSASQNHAGCFATFAPAPETATTPATLGFFKFFRRR